MLEYNLKDIKNSFGLPTYERGKKYFELNKVIKCKYSPELGKIIGSVAGAAQDSYSTNVEIKPSNRSGTVIIKSQCSCPVGWNCKHAVALLFAHQQQLTPNDPYQAWLKTLAAKPATKKPTFPGNELVDQAIFLLSQSSEDKSLLVEVGSAQKLKGGEYGRFSAKRLEELTNDYSWSNNWLTETDKNIVKLLLLKEADSYNIKHTKISTENDVLALEKMLDSGRCCWKKTDNNLRRGEKLPLQISWEREQDLSQIALSLAGTTPNWIIVPTPAPWYLDPDKALCGPIKTELEGDWLASLSHLPALTQEQASHFTNNFLISYSEESLPAPIELEQIEIESPLVPVLSLRKGVLENGDNSFIASFSFQYGQLRLSPLIAYQEKQTRFLLDDTRYQIKRQHSLEMAALDTYTGLDLQGINEHLLSKPLGQQRLEGIIVSPKDLSQQELWLEFSLEHTQRLESLGWLIELDKHINLEAEVIDGFDLIIEEQGSWFDLGLSIELDGKKQPLLPMLLEWLKRHNDWQSQQGDLLLPQENGTLLRLARESIEPILAILQELLSSNQDKLSLPNNHAALLAQLPHINNWVGGDHIKKLARKLVDFDGIREIAPPKTLTAELRPYQQQGLNWLVFLHEYGFGGILADDMGLGKTVQALAYLLYRKEQGLLDKPAMVICPTSLVGNWNNEAIKFANQLNVLVLHGPLRKDKFAEIEHADLIVTTYPLVVRDFDELSKREYSELILDEAQVIKNPVAKMSQTIKKLKSDHQLCLTGTPMENHLGELWSLYDFLMPGFLGTISAFNKHYRTPIEKEGCSHTKNWLKNKISPFLLRRTKDQVAKELPPKTEIIHTIEMPNEQRTLYESIRITMESKVRGLLQTKGLAKSRIEFLDALLKMRQACCDPQLVKLEQAQKIQQSAKLDFLMELLPEMLEEGRRILIFSQFAQMLALIEKRLKSADIDYCKLTGQTQKRGEVIDRFQNGEVPVFLISLKAGGVGLNLTAADTVIHYDPWWNPAAENQATDRAHRIGQDKPVFVYKLICEKTVEEKVLQLQKQKQQLADAVYGDKDTEQGLLTDSDQLLKLFESM